MNAVLVVKNFSKKYLNNDTYAVRNCSFSLQAGVIVGLIGHNGAGKSTLLKAITGINHFREGDILINGVSIKIHPLSAKHYFAFCADRERPEENLSGYQYLQFVGAIYNVERHYMRAKIKELATIFEFEPYLLHKIKTYSLGTKQKLALIKTFLADQPLIILDEPLNGLDPHITYILKKYLKTLKQEGKTILFSSHYIKVVENICDELLIIKKGRLLAHETIAIIQKNFPSLEVYYFAQCKDEA